MFLYTVGFEFLTIFSVGPSVIRALREIIYGERAQYHVEKCTVIDEISEFLINISVGGRTRARLVVLPPPEKQQK